jgi:Domain of Unknown Function (DUF1080)
MFCQRITMGCLLALTALLSFAAFAVDGQTATDKKAEKKKEVWTDPVDPALPVDFKFQGEFAGEVADGKKVGCQVIALGNGAFQAVMCKGGLPGAGWNGKDKSLMDGKIDGDKVVFVPSTGKRKYLAQSPMEFSATAKFPPKGQSEFSGDIIGDTFHLGRDGDKKSPYKLKKLERKSNTLGKKAPDGAVVLFDGSSNEEWNGGRLDKATGFLNTDGKDITTKRKFNNYSAHVEFMIPFRPNARGQGRGNSGFYQVLMYEVQILDSFGLEGKNNECGGVYERLDCKVNACLPPLQWQTYDIEFTNAVREGDKVVKKARITAKLNGIVIHDNAEIASPTGGHRNEPEGTPGALLLQGHDNPLQFRNIWVVERK